MDVGEKHEEGEGEGRRREVRGGDEGEEGKGREESLGQYPFQGHVPNGRIASYFF